jgi:release factor glutamine methyltransferase
MNGGISIAQSFAALSERLAAAGVPSPRLDARLIVAHALGLSAETVLWDRQRTLDDNQQAAIERLARRRAAREPVSHLLGRREFWSLPFIVTPDVLDPRPDSETIVEAVLDRRRDRKSALRILDLGTGSGCLLLALLAEYPCASGIGVDRSVAACRVASGNAAALGLARRASFLVADWGAAVMGPFDVIVANPPYIADGAIDALEPEVRRHEPRLALAGGRDGFDAYRRLGADLMRLLDEGGLAVVEVGAGMSGTASAILGVSGLFLDDVRRDLAGVERGLVMIHPAPNR